MKIIKVPGPRLAYLNLNIQSNDILFITDIFLQSDLENILVIKFNNMRGGKRKNRRTRKNKKSRKYRKKSYSRRR